MAPKFSAKPASAASKPAREPLILDVNFYKNNFRRLIKLNLFFLVLAFTLIGYIFYTWYERPDYRFFATTYDGNLIELNPLHTPGISDQDVARWTADLALSSFDFTFENYPSVLQGLRDKFSQEGFQRFLRNFSTTHYLRMVRENDFFVRAQAQQPLVFEKGLTQEQRLIKNKQDVIDGNVYYWKIKLPMSIRFENDSTRVQKDVVAYFLVKRSNRLESPNGIEIDHMIVQEPAPPEPPQSHTTRGQASQ